MWRTQPFASRKGDPSRGCLQRSTRERGTERPGAGEASCLLREPERSFPEPTAGVEEIVQLRGSGYVLLVILAGGGGGDMDHSPQPWEKQAAQSQKMEAAANRPTPVQTQPVQQRTMPIYLTALGTVTAYNTVTIRPRVDGQLLRVNFREGQAVNEGSAAAGD